MVNVRTFDLSMLRKAIFGTHDDSDATSIGSSKPSSPSPPVYDVGVSHQQSRVTDEKSRKTTMDSETRAAALQVEKEEEMDVDLAITVKVKCR